MNDATTTEHIVLTLMITDSSGIRINKDGTIWQSHGTIIMTNDDALYFGKRNNKCKTRISLIYVLGLPSVFSGVRVARSLIFCVVFCRSLLLLAIVLSVLLRFTDSDYRFGFLQTNHSFTGVSLIYVNHEYYHYRTEDRSSMCRCSWQMYTIKSVYTKL